MSAPARPRSRTRLALAALEAAVDGGCGAGRDAAGDAGGEFLLAAGDSTYWVSAGPGGARVRGAPLLLARWDGRLYEVYAADDDRSYYDAVFTSQRVFRRDLLGGDSLAVYDDPRVRTLADRYAVANPYERPLAPDEDAAEDPGTVATSEVSLLDVHGPYLTVEFRADVESRGGAADLAARLGRPVLDLRGVAGATLGALLGAGEAARL
ncbi:hypothetical protein, partial [Roseisolibacter sp. H3M3-2]|uniref:hypothetical protein n=1 Tax=Roseisolibacter sp. H3M3-2 TaxID=3031323 RepID=UPI0023D9B258